MTGLALAHQFAELRPHGGFELIMADPPWAFEARTEAGYGKSPQAHYACTGLDWIKALPVPVLAADDCLLWLWATNPMLPQAFEVLDAWGFTFATAGTWVKRTVRGKDAFGTGYVLRSSNEPFLIGKRGRPKTTRATRSTLVSYEAEGIGGRQGEVDFGPLSEANIWAGTVTIEAKLREHSRKPDAGFDAAEALMPGARRLELFSCETRPGWTGWGNEAGKFDARGLCDAAVGVLQ